MPSVKLTISPAENEPGNYLVVVSGEGFYQSSNKSVGARVRGDDSWFDDSLFGLGGTGIERVQSDGSFVLSNVVSGSQLNEDWGQDEIYALVSIDGLSGSYRTNTVKGSY